MTEALLAGFWGLRRASRGFACHAPRGCFGFGEGKMNLEVYGDRGELGEMMRFRLTN